MKHALIALLFILFAEYIYSQQATTINVEGNLFDTMQVIPIANSDIIVSINGTTEIKTATDSLGNYSFTFENSENTTTFDITIRQKNYFDVQFSLTKTHSTDTYFLYNANVSPAIVCWDSFLPEPILFAKNSCIIPNSSYGELILMLGQIRKMYSHYFLNHKLEISASASYGESKTVAQERMNAVYKLILSLDFKEADIALNLVNKDDLFICEFCDGCHYFFLKGTGKTLSKKEYQKLKSEEEKEAFVQLRQTVVLKWVRK